MTGTVGATPSVNLKLVDDAKPPQPSAAETSPPSFLANLKAAGDTGGAVLGDMFKVGGFDVPTMNWDQGNTLTVAGVGTAVTGISTMRAMAARSDLSSTMTKTEIAGTFGKRASVNGLRITPTLISAVAGPAIADGISYLAPNLVPKYKPVNNSTIDKKAKADVAMRRQIAGGVSVGALAGVVYLIKPDLFKGAGLMSANVVEGRMAATWSGGFIRDTTPMLTRDGVFSNRMMLGIAGAGVGLYFLNRALGKEGTQKRNDLIKAGAAVAVTAGAIAVAPKLTRGAQGALGVAMLPSKGMFYKPNLQWFKEFGGKVVPATGGIAYITAGQYFDTFNDFEQITGKNSQWRR